MIRNIQERNITEIIKSVPKLDLRYLLKQSNIRTQLLGEGTHGVVIQVENIAVKIGFNLGIDTHLAEQIAIIAHGNNIGPRARIFRSLTNELQTMTSYPRQVAAHIIGNRVKPNLIDAKDVSLVVFNSMPCGMTLPIYQGKFFSLSDPQFGLTTTDRADLESAGILLDDFQHRKNGVILLNGERKIFDLSLKFS